MVLSTLPSGCTLTTLMKGATAQEQRRAQSFNNMQQTQVADQGTGVEECQHTPSDPTSTASKFSEESFMVGSPYMC